MGSLSMMFLALFAMFSAFDVEVLAFTLMEKEEEERSSASQ